MFTIKQQAHQHNYTEIIHFKDVGTAREGAFINRVILAHKCECGDAKAFECGDVEAMRLLYGELKSHSKPTEYNS